MLLKFGAYCCRRCWGSGTSFCSISAVIRTLASPLMAALGHELASRNSVVLREEAFQLGVPERAADEPVVRGVVVLLGEHLNELTCCEGQAAPARGAEVNL